MVLEHARGPSRKSGRLVTTAEASSTSSAGTFVASAVGTVTVLKAAVAPNDTRTLSKRAVPPSASVTSKDWPSHAVPDGDVARPLAEVARSLDLDRSPGVAL